MDTLRVIEYNIVLLFWRVCEEIGTNNIPLRCGLRGLLAQPPDRQLDSGRGGVGLLISSLCPSR
jgi:hypothetical protein